MKVEWTETENEKLRLGLVVYGLPYSQVADRMFRDTRGKAAVKAQARRLGLRSTVPSGPTHRWTREHQAKPPRLYVPPPPYAGSLRLTLADLEAHQCRYPDEDSDGPNHSFCGQPSHPDRPYCEHHCKIAYTEWPKQ